MRTYLVDGTNAVRRGRYDPRFPEVEEAETEHFLSRLNRAAELYEGRIQIEVFFYGPMRALPPVEPPISLRFTIDGDADAAILGSVRSLRDSGRGAVVVTEDGGLAAEAGDEGAKVIRISDLLARLRERRA